MSVVFASAFLVGVATAVFRSGLSFKSREIAFGALIGIPNLFSTIFLIWAFAWLDGSVVYPSVNILVVVAGALVGLIVWKDRVTKNQWLGMALAVAAIAIMLYE